jgi:hypothetical protein
MLRHECGGGRPALRKQDFSPRRSVAGLGARDVVQQARGR